MQPENANTSKQISTRRWVLGMTLLYLIVFPFLLYASLFSVAILNPEGMLPLQIFFIFLCVATPLSIPLSIFFMWRRFTQEKYSEVSFFFVLPVIVAVICFYSIRILSFLFSDAMIGK